MDLRVKLSETVTEWAACVDPYSTLTPVRTLIRHLAAALAMTGGDSYAGRLLHLTDVARRRLDPPEVVRIRERCPICHTRGWSATTPAARASTATPSATPPPERPAPPLG
ncbi:hypothetical protein [Actinomadura sp. 6N118]|uniref:hypothetical protein n=1 Tax=Actinomadura sp. 6N118 TaxID=3375151 RepID=UPI0037A3FFED